MKRRGFKKEQDIRNLDETTQEEIALYVGENFDKYLKKWEKLEKSKTGISMNWAAILFGMFWFMNRKMYFIPMIFFGITSLADFIVLFTFHTEIKISTYNGISLLFSLMGNAIYRDHVIKKVRKIQENYPDEEERKKILKKKGGTSWGMSILYLLISLVYGFVFYEVADIFNIKID